MSAWGGVFAGDAARSLQTFIYALRRMRGQMKPKYVNLRRKRGAITMKKKIAAGAVLVLCLSMLIYSTIAYFNTADTARNVITSGNIKIALNETDAEGEPFKDAVDVMPGQTVDKIVTVQNTGNNPAYIRVSVTKAIELAEGASGDPDTNLLTLDFDMTHWTLQGEYYYYNEVLEPGQTTEPLFKSVTFDTSMGNMYQDSKAVITVSAQATQVKNNGDTVFDAKGWPTDTDKPTDGE